jgi:hypothetical protein
MMNKSCHQLPSFRLRDPATCPCLLLSSLPFAAHIIHLSTYPQPNEVMDCVVSEVTPSAIVAAAGPLKIVISQKNLPEVREEARDAWGAPTLFISTDPIQ